MDNIDIFLVSRQVIMLFIIIITGIYARKIKVIDANSTNALSKLLLNITQPLLIITSFQIDFDSEKLMNGFTILGISVIIHTSMAFFSKFIYMPFKKNREDRKIYEICSIFNNCAFLGYPVLKVVFGDNLGIFYGAFYTIYFNIFIWTYGVYLLTKENNSDDNDGDGKKIKLSKASVMKSASKIFLNTGFIASVFGLIIFVFRIKLPTLLYDSAKLVGDMTFPLSMLIIGSLIANLDFKGLFLSIKNYYYVLIKLIVLPVVTASIFCILKADVYLIYVATIMASMPAAANNAIFAETYGANSELAGKLVGLSTLISIVSIPVILYILEFMLKV